MADAVDPKELLVNNKALFGVYGAALLPVILWFVWLGAERSAVQKQELMLQGQANQLKSLHQRIQNPTPDNPVYTPQDVHKLQQRQLLHQQELEKLGQVIGERDAELERWFDEFKDLDAGKLPDRADYVTRWDENIKQLESRYRSLVIDEETGASVLYSEKPAPDRMREAQKRFWIQAALLEALEAGGATRVLSRMQFEEKRAPAGVNEQQVPYVTIPARISFLCTLTRVPAVVQAILSRKIPVRVASLQVEKAPFELRKDPKFGFGVDGTDTVFHEHAYGAKVDNQAQVQANEPWIVEPPVKVDLVVEAYDFNKIEKPAPDAPVDGELPPY